MKISFDGMRKNIANSFNKFMDSVDKELLSEHDKECLNDLRYDIEIMLCAYDDGIKDDCNCLVDDVELHKVF